MEFWEGLQTLGLGRDLPRWHASLIVEPFQASASCTVICYNVLIMIKSD